MVPEYSLPIYHSHLCVAVSPDLFLPLHLFLHLPPSPHATASMKDVYPTHLTRTILAFARVAALFVDLESKRAWVHAHNLWARILIYNNHKHT